MRDMENIVRYYQSCGHISKYALHTLDLYLTVFILEGFVADSSSVNLPIVLIHNIIVQNLNGWRY